MAITTRTSDTVFTDENSPGVWFIAAYAKNSVANGYRAYLVIEILQREGTRRPFKCVAPSYFDEKALLTSGSLVLQPAQFLTPSN